MPPTESWTLVSLPYKAPSFRIPTALGRDQHDAIDRKLEQDSYFRGKALRGRNVGGAVAASLSRLALWKLNPKPSEDQLKILNLPPMQKLAASPEARGPRDPESRPGGLKPQVSSSSWPSSGSSSASAQERLKHHSGLV